MSSADWRPAWTSARIRSRTPHLTRLSGAEQVLEIERSKHALEETLRRPIKHFCYPYGDFDADCVRAVRASGYLSAVTTQRGFASQADDLHCLKRISVNASATGSISFCRSVPATKICAARGSTVKLLFVDSNRGVGGTEHHAVALGCAMRDIGHQTRTLIRGGTWLASAFENAGIATAAIAFRGGFDPYLASL